MSRVLHKIAPVLLFAILVAVWEAACRAFAIPSYFLPPPSEIARAAADNWRILLASSWNTLAMALEALLVSSVLACSVAVIVALNETIERSIRPLAVSLQVTPVIAIAPQVVIWAGLERPERAIISLAVIVAFFPIFSGALTGLKATDPDLERLFDLYEASRWQRLWRLRIPSSIPFVLEGHKVAGGLAVIGAVVAEFVAGSGGAQGLAWRILEASNRLQTAKTFAAVIVLAIMGALLNAALRGVERIVLQRMRG
jgi:NitT/TauT family transport system permease protein